PRRRQDPHHRPRRAPGRDRHAGRGDRLRRRPDPPRPDPVVAADRRQDRRHPPAAGAGRAAAPMTTPRDLADRIAAARSPGLVLDFDGTLAPIVADPESSALPDGVAPVLADLARRLPLVALVSGRPVAFLAERAAIDGVRLLGLYG